MTMYMTNAAEKYHRDAQFKAVVDMLVAHAMSMDMAPGELREAAMFAEIKFQCLKPVETLFPHRYQEINREMMADSDARERAKRS